jgi:hypothetical protein
VLPPSPSVAFVAALEDVLAVYARPYDPARPVVGIDAGGQQRIGDVRPPLPTRPGTPARVDDEYERNGMANLFLAFEPLAGQRHVEVTARRASVDFARFARRVLDEWSPTAAVVVFVVDNLSTHTPAAFSEAFEPAEVRRLAERVEWHDTPNHGSWRNVAELELSVRAWQCLDRRIPDHDTLRRQTAAWEGERDAAVVRGDWPFTAADARVKLKRLYPALEVQ